MRLSDVLSKLPTHEFKQVEGFLGEKTLGVGKQRKIRVGEIGINYFCGHCTEASTFLSGEIIYCIGVNDHLISIDSVLRCCKCKASVQVWFLVDCDGPICGHAPLVRILKRSEKLSSFVKIKSEAYGEFSSLLDWAERAYRENFGAGSVVYLRKAFEKITAQVADTMEIGYSRYESGNPRNFRVLLEKVDGKNPIIPEEFSKDGYKLFRELSDIIHGEYDEEEGLKKFKPLYRLVTGILEKVRNSKEFQNATMLLGWGENRGDSDE